MLCISKSFLFYIFILFNISFSQSYENKIISCQPISLDSINILTIYNDLILKLKKENKIDKSDASIIKMISSSGFVAFRQTPDSIVKEKGKIEKRDIRYICSVKEINKTYYLIITESLGFCHAFIYDHINHKLHRVKKSNSIPLFKQENIIYKEYSDTNIIFISTFKKYIIYDNKSETFFFKRIKNDKEN